ncbi:hypothetical protein AOLI_G00219040 [Acnodon oligacanthus]
MREYMGWLYYQYLLITGIYVLEPWEKSIFNTVLFTMVAMVVYTSYVFVPIHVRLALEFFSGLCGEQPERTFWRNERREIKVKNQSHVQSHLFSPLPNWLILGTSPFPPL